MTQNASEFGFSEQEWNVLFSTPVLAGLTVAHAHFSGPTGVREENRVLDKCFDEHPEDHALIVRLKTAVLESGLLDQKPSGKAGELKARTVEQLQQVRALLEHKTNSEAYRAYGDFLGKVMSRVAGAARDGNFLNAEPNKVSDTELVVISELLKVLD